MPRPKEHILNKELGSKVFITILKNPGIHGLEVATKIYEKTDKSKKPGESEKVYTDKVYKQIHELEDMKLITTDEIKDKGKKGKRGRPKRRHTVNFISLVEVINNRLPNDKKLESKEERETLKGILQNKDFIDLLKIDDSNLSFLMSVCVLLSHNALWVLKFKQYGILQRMRIKPQLKTKIRRRMIKTNGVNLTENEKREATDFIFYLSKLPDPFLKKLITLERPETFKIISYTGDILLKNITRGGR